MGALEDAWELSRAETGLAIVSTVRADLTVQSTLVNTGLLAHPADGTPVPAYDRTMAEQRRTAVLITPTRFYPAS
ncbi:hypothetical protein [Actinoplanes sp. OR16]|uniref:hypothetical protein n=1 Tax=Actinoplanes sp. OR16 TaxID=946334 RepID=UPI000FD9C762|nr:hypothetical protein [Actinoplanes sp. OR16]